MNLLSKAWGYVAVAFGAVAAIAIAYLKGSKAGIDALKAKNKEETIKTMRKAREIRDAARALSEPAIDKRLSKYRRAK